MKVAVGKSPTLWIGLGVIFSFWLWAPFIGNNTQAEWLRAFQITVGYTVVVAYLPGIVAFLTKDGEDATTQQLTTGIVVTWSFSATGALYLLIWRMAGQPEWMVNNEINSFFIWGQIIGGVLHVTAPRKERDQILRPHYLRMWIALTAGVIFGYMIAEIRPNAGPMMEGVREYLSAIPNIFT